MYGEFNEKYKTIRDHVLVTDMGFTERLSRGGLVLLSDDKKSEGIRPRWGRIVAVGHEQTHVKVGQWIMVEHGRWTRGIKLDGMTIRRVDNKDIMMVSNTKHEDETVGNYD